MADMMHSHPKPLRRPLKACSHCGQGFKDSAMLRAHAVIHTGQNYSSCATCVEGFTQTADLRDHLVTHVIVPSLLFDTNTMDGINSLLKVQFMESTMNCQPKDEIIEVSNDEFIEASTSAIEDKPHGCLVCGKQFARKSTLNRHTQTHSAEKTKTNCQSKDEIIEVSNVEFIEVPASAIIHTMTNKGKSLHRCSWCGMEFQKAVYLRRHMMTHTGEKPYGCSICGKMFSRTSILNRHKITHSAEKPKECAECGRRFRDTYTLEKHMLTHTGEKPHECSYCGKRFRLVDYLNCHVRTHTGEKPYQCSICGKGFTMQTNLTSHLMVHSGEKPHSCSQCGKSFTYKGNLDKHLKVYNH